MAGAQATGAGEEARRGCPRFLLATLALHPVGCRDECEFGSGPWLPAKLGDPCDGPPDVWVNASDFACPIYQCVDGHWESDA